MLHNLSTTVRCAAACNLIPLLSHFFAGAAAIAGICKGDRIVKVNGVCIDEDWTHDGLVELIEACELLID